MMVSNAAARPYERPVAAPKAEQYNSHVDALVAQNYGYARPWWEVYGDTPEPSMPELSRSVWPSNDPAAVRFRAHYQ
jgi:hypothetical protein